jgi:ABC-type protease/lipase transport system fused ATPase/permease subunit
LLDIPWTPLFILICFVIHPAIGVLAVGGAALIFSLALINERSSRTSLEGLSQKSSFFFAGHEADLGMAETVHALGAEHALTNRRIASRGALVEAPAARIIPRSPRPCAKCCSRRPWDLAVTLPLNVRCRPAPSLPRPS